MKNVSIPLFFLLLLEEPRLAVQSTTVMALTRESQCTRRRLDDDSEK